MNRVQVSSFAPFAVACLLAASGCVQSLGEGDLPQEPGSVPADALADDSQLKLLGDLGPAPLQIEPARPFSEQPYTVSVQLDGAVSAAVSATGAGCGSFAATSAALPLHLDGMTATQGICRFSALLTMTDGSSRTFTSSFEVHETDPSPLPMEVSGAVYRAGPMPAASDDGPEIISIDGATTFVNGGNLSWLIEHDSERTIVAVMVSLDGYPGHYLLPVDELDESVPLELHFRRDAFAWMNGARNNTLGIGVALLDSLGAASPLSLEPVEGVPVGSGGVDVSISWDADADLDLFVTEPNGETIFYGNRESLSGGRLDLDSNPTCDLDGLNAEHIFWPSHGAPSGSYQARVHLYDACSTGSVSGTLTINACDGEPAQSHAFTLSESFPELLVDFDATCAGASVSGRVRFEDFAISSSGLSSSGTLVPARFVKVEAVAASGGTVIASTHTDRTGRYSLDIPVAVLSSGNPDVRVRAVADADIPQARQRVGRGGSHTYKWTHPDRFDPTDGDPVVRNLDIREDEQAGALNLWDVGVSGFKYLRSVSQNLPKIHWKWRKGSQYGSYASGDSIHMAGSSSDPDEYDDFVAAHELGHSVMYLLSNNDQAGIDHSPLERTRPNVAWGEGWASYFGAVVNRSGRYIDTLPGGVGISMSIETLPSSVPLGTRSNSLSGNISEGVVSAVLWDMHDRTNESKDTLSGLDPAHWAVMRGYLGADTAEYDGGRGNSGRALIDFLDGWLCPHGDSRNGDNASQGLRGNVRGIHEVPYDFPDYECD